MMARFDVRARGPGVLFSSLSGGNQQKAVLAREITLPNLTCLVAAQPTRGLDVGAVAAVYGHIRAACERGIAILLVSSELDELLSVADRIVVLYRGRIMGSCAADPGATRGDRRHDGGTSAMTTLEQPGASAARRFAIRPALLVPVAAVGICGAGRARFDRIDRRARCPARSWPSSTARSARPTPSPRRSIAASPLRWSASASCWPTAPTSPMSAAKDRSRSAASPRPRSRCTAHVSGLPLGLAFILPMLAAVCGRRGLGRHRRA